MNTGCKTAIKAAIEQGNSTNSHRCTAPYH